MKITAKVFEDKIIISGNGKKDIVVPSTDNIKNYLFGDTILMELSGGELIPLVRKYPPPAKSPFLENAMLKEKILKKKIEKIQKIMDMIKEGNLENISPELIDSLLKSNVEVHHVSAAYSQQLITINVTINDHKKVKAVVDTGATINCIDNSMIDRKNKKVGQVYVGGIVAGQYVPVVQSKIKYKNNSLITEFAVIPNLASKIDAPILIGLPIIKKWGFLKLDI
ncbi:MAG: aspartyl protease family protein [Promethearchaeota archaeon]